MAHSLEPIDILEPSRRRAPWRQRLVETERGLALGMRSDSSLHFYLFLNSAIIAVGGVLGLSTLQWLFVVLVATTVITAELVRQALRLLVGELQELKPGGPWERILALTTAAVSVAFAGGTVIVTVVFWQRIRDTF